MNNPGIHEACTGAGALQWSMSLYHLKPVSFLPSTVLLPCKISAPCLLIALFPGALFLPLVSGRIQRTDWVSLPVDNSVCHPSEENLGRKTCSLWCRTEVLSAAADTLLCLLGRVCVHARCRQRFWLSHFREFSCCASSCCGCTGSFEKQILWFAHIWNNRRRSFLWNPFTLNVSSKLPFKP